MDHVVAASTPLVDRLTRAQRYASQGLARALREDGCTLDQWRLLRVLVDGEGHLMGELATALAVPQPTLTRLVDGLTDRACVFRRACEVDGRKVGVHLSRQGRILLARLDALAAAHESALRDDPVWQQMSDGLLRD